MPIIVETVLVFIQAVYLRSIFRFLFEPLERSVSKDELEAVLNVRTDSEYRCKSSESTIDS